jgi:hypothetical protein
MSPDFFLDTFGCIAKIITSTLLDFNVDVIIFRVLHSPAHFTLQWKRRPRAA